jgi:hypothetical protein
MVMNFRVSYTRRHKAIRCFRRVFNELFSNVYFHFIMFFALYIVTELYNTNQWIAQFSKLIIN